jgi:enoyl-CoA hydratase/carnithine racemase
MSAPDQPFVLREDRDGISTVVMNRGDRFNPLSASMIAALIETLDAIARDTSVRAVILKGGGRGFCAGHDLKEMQANRTDAWFKAMFDSCSDLMLRITQLPQPVIAQVHGIATAAGCQLTAMCDLAVAASDARFALPGVNVGLFCSTPAVGVARNIGRKRVMEMLLTGEPISAETALEWGLVNRVVPADRLEAETRHLAERIASKSAAVVAMGKQAFYQQLDKSLAGAYALTGETMTCNMRLDDNREGIDAFLNKRHPEWRHR